MKAFPPPGPRRAERVAALLLILAWSASCIAGPAPPHALPERVEPTERVTISDGWLAMGTFFEADLRVSPQDEARARRWLSWARGEIARLERIYSRHDPESELSALNRALAQQADEPSGVSGAANAAAREDDVAGVELGALVARALDLSRATDGAFMVTIGPLVDLWIGAAAADRWPTDDALRAARARVDPGRMDVSAHLEGLRVRASERGMRLDLDGLSKGAVLDRLRRSLAEQLPDAAALLGLGESSVVAIGDPGGGGGWRLAIRSRDPERGWLGTVRLRDRALSVSSSVGSGSEIAGHWASHVIDPRTGLPIEGTIEAIVVARDATTADAWSTALLVLGATPGALERLESHELEAQIVDRSGRIWTTEGWTTEGRSAPAGR